MTKAMKSVFTGEDVSIRDLISDAVGVLAISVTTIAMLWLPAILSA
ncbi:hypothetical protein [Paracoccus aerodenitrificans]|nr:hypothetical protein [Paracoccus aerodenitrificans]WBU65446.1 hypothetical protein PAE61_08510 [Paracoccus aerodenitrificans]